MTEKPDIGDDFRAAMRDFAATVTIISAGSEGDRAGMTATSVVSVSLDPPSLLFCINQSAALHDYLVKGEGFCVNVLAAGQEDISAAFGGDAKGEDRFAASQWKISAAGTPYLAAAKTNIFCDCTEMIIHGTHSIAIGQVRDVRRDESAPPLIYLDGNYRTLSSG